MIQKIDDEHTIIDGKVLISEVNDLFGLSIDDADVDTIGGWILTEHYDIKAGDSVQIDRYSFKVLEMDGHHVKTLEVTRLPVLDNHEQNDKNREIAGIDY
jgi:CBS domain containing-hemolysin-like protein